MTSVFMKKPKKNVLTLEQEFNFELIGICSHHSDYRLAWNLNEQLKIQLSKSDTDYIAVNKKGEILSSHSQYEFKDIENLTEYYLIKNNQLGKMLIPEKPSIDFFLFLVENHVWELPLLIQQLKSASSVLGSFIFDPTEIGSAENLVFDE
jgi:hypothetical protein